MSNRKLLTLLLRKKGINCEMAEDGLIAYELVKKRPLEDTYDIIFLDNTMPNMVTINLMYFVTVCQFQLINTGFL